MTARFGSTRRPLRALARSLAMALALGVVAAPGLARADDEPGWFSKALGLRTETPKSPDFVVKTRPAKTDFVPVHSPRVGPTSKPMSKEQVVAQEKSLDSSRKAHDRIAGRRGAEPEKSVAEGLEERKQRVRTQENCGLTCSNPSLLPAQPGREYR